MGLFMCESGSCGQPPCHHAEGRQISLKHPCGGKVDISNSGTKEEVVPHQSETTVHLDVQVCLSASVSHCPSFSLSVAPPPTPPVPCSSSPRSVDLLCSRFSSFRVLRFLSSSLVVPNASWKRLALPRPSRPYPTTRRSSLRPGLLRHGGRRI